MRRQLCSPLMINNITPKTEQRLREVWNERNLDPLAYTPSEELMRGVGEQEATERNFKLAAFSVRYLKAILTQVGVNFHLPEVARRVAREEIAVIAGYGRGYDSEAAKHFTSLGYSAWIIDVSDVSTNLASLDLSEYCRSLPGPYQMPRIKRAELQSVLQHPGSVGLDFSKVKWWYVCRFFGCLSDTIARSVAQEIGRSLSDAYDHQKTNGIVVVNAFQQGNTCVESRTSKVRRKATVVRNVQFGAERPVLERYECCDHYYDKVVTAVTLQAA